MAFARRSETLGAGSAGEAALGVAHEKVPRTNHQTGAGGAYNAMKNKKKLKPAPNLVHVLHAYRDLKRSEACLDRAAGRMAESAYELLSELNNVSDSKFRELPIVELLRQEVRTKIDALTGLSSR